MTNVDTTRYHYRVAITDGVPFRDNLRMYANKILQYVARKFLLPPSFRTVLQSLRGVRFIDPKSVFLGEDVFIDEVFPDRVKIGRNVMITEGVMIFTHLYDPAYSQHAMEVKDVVIEDDVFIGARSLILNGVKVGKGAVVGAASVVTKDIKPYAIVAGSPAREVGNRGSLSANELRSMGALRRQIPQVNR